MKKLLIFSLAKSVSIFRENEECYASVSEKFQISLMINYFSSPFAFILTTTVIFLLLWLKRRFTYWQRKGLNVPSFKFHYKYMKNGFLQENAFADRDLEIYQYMKRENFKHGGLYFFISPFYVPLDPEIIKLIVQNDFDNFADRGMYINEQDPLSTHLFNLPGKKWKMLRAKLSPTFTSGKMKMMFETLLQCTDGLDRVMDNSLGEPLDIKDILGRFTTDVIVSCAFGLNSNSLANPDNEFRTNGRCLFMEKSFLQNVKFGLLFTIPKVMGFFNVRYMPKEVSEFFQKVVQETVTYREKNEVFRKDFLHLLIQLKNRGQLVDDDKLTVENMQPGENTITMDEIVAQAHIFFEAGLETSATTMKYCLYELSKHKNYQDRVRREIHAVLAKYDGQSTYEAVHEMTYLDQVVNETLRKYPPLSSLPRICTKNYKVPGYDLVIEKGVRVVIPVFGLHRDPDHYPEPMKFDPERFSEEGKKNIKEFTYMPFGYGPRLCIGMRFGLIQAKIGLISLLKSYEFSVNPKTKEPLEFDPKILNMSVKGGLWLDHKKVDTTKILKSN